METNCLDSLVSVIIPCYNAEKFIAKCIDSVLSQDYNNIEIIIVDDGSTDLSIDIIKSYDGIKYFRQKNAGACAARNYGLSVSKGKYIKFLDADDSLCINVIKRQVMLAEELGDYAIVYGDLYISRGGVETYKSVKLSSHQQVAKLFISDIFISTPLHHRWMLVKIGGFDILLKNGQEWNLHIRLAAEGYKFIHVELAIFRYNIHDSITRISNIDYNKIESIKYSIEKTVITNNIICSSSDDVRNAISMRYWWAARAMLREGAFALSKAYRYEAKLIGEDHKQFWPNEYKLIYRLFGFHLGELLYVIFYRFRVRKYSW